MRSTLEIDLDRLAYNYAMIRTYLPTHTEIMPVIKANAYGVGAELIGSFLQELGAPIFGVAHVQEGIKLREQGITTPILALQSSEEDFELAAEHAIEVSLHSENFPPFHRPLKVHLHVNTGMNRLGVSPKKALKTLQAISQSPHLTLQGLYSHFSSASNPKEDPFSLEQISTLIDIIKASKHLSIPSIHISNSAGLLRFTLPEFNLVRPGLLLYGISPLDEEIETFPFKPVLTLSSKIQAIHNLQEGESVSYNRNYRTKNGEEKIAVLPIGYHDGIPRNLSNRGSVRVCGLEAPIVGNICMDALMINVTHIPQVKIGDRALFFGRDSHGEEIPIEKMAKDAATIPYEIISRLGPRIQRVPLKIPSKPLTLKKVLSS